jgi:putative redox protein
MAEVTVSWVADRQFVASGSGGHSIVLDSSADVTSLHGFKPTELLLAAVGGCTAMDVIDILRKKRQQVSDLRVSVHGERAAELPTPFTIIDVHYEVHGTGVNPRAVERAIELSQEKYCSVSATVRGVATIRTTFTVVADSE